MGEIKIFESPLFGHLRTTTGASGEPLVCLTDVCKAVGLTNPSSVKNRLDEEDVQLIDLHALNSTEGTIIGNSKANFITESGFYDVLLQSTSQKVKPFRKWVTSEVLPAIRKNGAYVLSKENETPEELMARALVAAQEALQRKEQRLKEVEAKNSQQAERIELQSEELKKQAPKVAYHDEVLTSTSTYNTTNIAKEFGMGAPTLNKILHEKGIQYKMDGQWLLYHKYQGLGYTRTVTNTYDNGYGEVHTRQQTVWTERGRQFIHQVMKADLLAKATI